MADHRLRELERAAAQRPEDDEAAYRLLLERSRTGRLDPDAATLLGWCEPGGVLCPARLEVVQLALAGDLAHGSWVQLYRYPDGVGPRGREGELRQRPGSGRRLWWAVQWWWQGADAMAEERPLGWLAEGPWRIVEAGVSRQGRRRGTRRYTGGGHVDYPELLRGEQGLGWLARYLHLALPCAKGRRAWEIDQQLPLVRRAATLLEQDGRVGPAASWERRQARDAVGYLEDELRDLLGEL